MPIKFKSALITLAANLFVLLFVYTAVSKFLSFKLFELTLSHSPLISNYSSIIALLLPIIELVVACLLVFGKSKRLGLFVALILMIVFTAYILYMLLFVPNLPCSCGGVLKSMTWTQHLIFNIAFLCLALLSVIIDRHETYILDKNASYKMS
jgi:hypothetical protein